MGRFLKAQEQGSTKEFYTQVHEDWEKAFPLGQPSEAEISKAGGQERAIRDKTRKQEQCLAQWYHNNTWPSQSLSKEAVIPVKKTLKTPALWQAYSTLYYQSKLKTLVDEAWAAYLKETKLKESEAPLCVEGSSDASNSASGNEKLSKTSKTRIQLQNEVIRAEYKKETPEVKAEVEAYVKNLKESKSKSPEAEGKDVQLEKFQRGIDKIPRTVVAYLNAIHEETGWSGSILVGGPNPARGGLITTFEHHVGETADEDATKFNQYYGSLRWSQEMLSRWDDFLHKVYPEHICASRAFEGKTPPPDKDDDDEALPSSLGMDYERQKAANLNRNRALLESIIASSSIEKSDENGSGKETANDQGLTRSSPLAQTQVNYNPSPTPNDAVVSRSNPSATPISSLSTTSPTSTNDTHEMNVDRSLPTPENDSVNLGDTNTKTVSFTESEESHKMEDVRTAEQPTNSIDTLSTTKSIETPSVIEAQAMTDAVGGQATTDPAGGQAMTDVAGGQATTDPAGSQATMDMAGGQATAGGQAMTNLIHAQAITSAVGGQATTNPILAWATTNVIDPQITTNPIEPQADGGQVVTGVQPTNENVELTGDYIADGASYFKTLAPNVESWARLVSTWVAFESQCAANDINIGNLPTQKRPNEVGWWLKRHRKIKALPPINISKYQPAWHAWWLALQPDWRQSSGAGVAWPLSRALPPNSDWKGLFRAGPNGFFVLMMSLAWWAETIAKSAVSEYAEFTLAVEDVLWALSKIMLQLPAVQISLKRSSPDIEDSEVKPKSKRARK